MTVPVAMKTVTDPAGATGAAVRVRPWIRARTVVPVASFICDATVRCHTSS